MAVNRSAFSVSPDQTATGQRLKVIAQQSDKTAAQVAQEFNAFQQVLSTYDAGKQLFPNLPQHTENQHQDNNNTSPNTTTRYAGSPPLDPPGT